MCISENGEINLSPESSLTDNIPFRHVLTTVGHSTAPH